MNTGFRRRPIVISLIVLAAGAGLFLSIAHRRGDSPRGSGDLEGLLQPGMKMLVHGRHDGLPASGAQLINDATGRPDGISYPSLDTPAATSALWRKIGATHSVWYASRPPLRREEVAGEVVFLRAIDQYGEDLGLVGVRRFVRLAGLSRHPELAAEPTRVLLIGCEGDPPSGVYTARALGDSAPAPATALISPINPPAFLRELGRVNAVVFRSRCQVAVDVQSMVSVDFKRMVQAGDQEIWIRTRVSTPSPDRSP